jgi:hypothetical protein
VYHPESSIEFMPCEKKRGACFSHVPRNVAEIDLHPNSHTSLPAHHIPSRNRLHTRSLSLHKPQYGILADLRTRITAVPVVQTCHSPCFLQPAFANPKCAFHEPFVKWMDLMATIPRPRKQIHTRCT